MLEKYLASVGSVGSEIDRLNPVIEFNANKKTIEIVYPKVRVTIEDGAQRAVNPSRTLNRDEVSSVMREVTRRGFRSVFAFSEVKTPKWLAWGAILVASASYAIQGIQRLIEVIPPLFFFMWCQAVSSRFH